MKIAGKVIDRYDAFLLLIVALWLAVGFYNLDVKSLSYDEGFAIYLAQMPIADMVRATASDIHPPLYYLLLHGWMNFFGDSVFAVRSLSVIFAAGAVVVTYFVGRTLFDKRVGVLSALLFSVSVFELQLSQEARMYSLMVLLACTSMVLLHPLHPSKGSRCIDRLRARDDAAVIHARLRALSCFGAERVRDHLGVDGVSRTPSVCLVVCHAGCAAAAFCAVGVDTDPASALSRTRSHH